MTVTLTFGPQVEEGLAAKAKAKGMGLEEYLQQILEQDALPLDRHGRNSEPSSREDAVRRMIEFGEKYRLSLGEAFTRESLHDGHRY